MPVLDAAAHAELIDALTALAVQAALAIRRAGHIGGVRRKADGSPVTAADEAAEVAIGAGLARLAPDIPFISEERKDSHKPSVYGGSYFLVDPLDGTREFIAGRDEYTVNIALMQERAPLLGVVAAPALGLVWRGIVGRSAERLTFDDNGAMGRPSAIHTRPAPRSAFIVLVSRSHLEARSRAYIEQLPQAKTLACGSSLKFCRIAEGKADLYPRLAPTHDWDIAAGQAIVEAAGGRMTAPDGGRLIYGTPELIVPGFIAAGDARRAPSPGA